MHRGMAHSRHSPLLPRESRPHCRASAGVSQAKEVMAPT